MVMEEITAEIQSGEVFYIKTILNLKVINYNDCRKLVRKQRLG
jgi:hypothetical protein